MPQIPVHVASHPSTPSPNPLPTLLHTPNGLALLELQATIHFPTTSNKAFTEVGKLVFPLYKPDFSDPADTKWMKRVYLYVGKHQRLTGEVKKLGKPFAVVRRKGGGQEDVDGMEGVEGGDRDGEGETEVEELEIAEVVRYRIVFSSRPEPVSGESEEQQEDV